MDENNNTNMLMRLVMNSAIKRIESVMKMFEYKPVEMDMKTILDDASEVDEFASLHMLHKAMSKWRFKDGVKYESPINYSLEEKKRLKVSVKGSGRGDARIMLKEASIESNEENKKSTMQRLRGDRN